jgi:hypothetical protein
MTTMQTTDPIETAVPGRSFDLTDLKGSVRDYLKDHVTMTVSDVEPVDPIQRVLTPGERGKFTFTATNGDENTGFRLLDVRYHLQVKVNGVVEEDEDGPSVVGLLAVPGAVIRNSSDPEGNVVVPLNTPVSVLWIQNGLEQTLDAGQTSAPLTVEVECIGGGEVELTVHAHADLALDSLFPRDDSRNGTGKQSVVVL